MVMIRLTGFAILAAGALFLTWVIDARSQALSTWAYTLEDQNEPELLALRTQYGTFRIQRSDDWTCSYLMANTNVMIAEWDETTVRLLIPLEASVLSGELSCRVTLVAQMDEWQCFTNGMGDCDVKVENDPDA